MNLDQIMKDDHTCSECRHWNKQPRDPHNLAAPQMGVCREQIHMIAIPVGPSQLQMTAAYAQTAGEFPCCGRFSEKKQLTGV